MATVTFTTRASLVAGNPENIADVTSCLDLLLAGVNSVDSTQIATQQAWQALSLTGGASLHYYKDTLGFVHLRNEVWTFTSTVTANTALGTMPVGYRPGTNVNAVLWLIAAAASASAPSAVGSFSINTSGVITWSSGASVGVTGAGAVYVPALEGWRGEN